MRHVILNFNKWTGDRILPAGTPHFEQQESRTALIELYVMGKMLSVFQLHSTNHLQLLSS